MIGDTEPDAGRARALEQYLIATIDHGFNASTFTARVIASTGADVGACVVGAVGALSGPLHGGAPSRALDLLDEIGTADRIDEVVVPKLESGASGSWASATPCTRARILARKLLRQVARDQAGPRVELAEAVERRVIELLAERKPERDLRTNVEFYAGVVMESCGLPANLFTADVRHQPHRRVGARTCSNRPTTPASCDPAPATSARRPRSPSPRAQRPARGGQLTSPRPTGRSGDEGRRGDGGAPSPEGIGGPAVEPNRGSARRWGCGR